MTNEEKILERLERLEKKIDPIAESAASVKELKMELAPRANEAVHYLIGELADIEADFQLEDLIFFCKKALRNINNLNYSMDMLQNLIDFATMAEPLMKNSVPQVIQSLDDLEQNNVFKLADITIQTLKKIGKTYTEEEFQQIGDGLVRLTGLLRDLTSTESLDLLEKASRIPGAVDLNAAKPLGPFSMFGAMSDAKVKEGMGVLMELTKGLPAMKKS
ncbi:MAG: DUF1641 domain-containing protein [Thermodesulfobacteriota bacterium]